MAATTAKYVFYHYDPSMAAAVVFTILFFVTTLVHMYQMVVKRTWFFISFVIGGVFEAIGYVGRAVSSSQTPNWTKEPYICQSLLLLLAPALFAASIYMLLARTIRVTDAESHSLIKVKWLTTLFVCGDVLSFLTQSAGGGFLAAGKDANAVKSGENIIVGGLFIQVFFFGFFVIMAGIFQHRILRYPTGRSKAIAVPWQKHLVILYVASALIMVRSVVRIAQYIQGSDGVLQQNEVFLYVFDGTLMFLVMVLYNVWHPSQIITKHLLAKTSTDPESLVSSYPIPERATGGRIAAN